MPAREPYLNPDPMPDGLDAYQELVWHLNRLPGGAHAAISDFFGGLLTRTPEPACWHFSAGGPLTLSADGALWHADACIAHLPPPLLAAAEADSISPILLGLLALAVGHIPGDRRLKAALPKVDAAAKDLMLMTVCRLCG